MKKSKTMQSLDKLAQDEQSFLGSEFVAPRLHGQVVQVQIAGMLCPMAIVPRNFTGWGRFRPIDFRRARLVREAAVEEREHYLKFLPAVRMLVAGRDDDGFMGVPAHGGDVRFKLGGPARLHFAESLELFDCVIARFDGSQFLYDEPDNRRSPAFAEALRTSLSEGAETVDSAGLLPEERWLFVELAKEAKITAELERKNNAEYRIADALTHAGAVMRSYIERNDGYTVEFMLNGERHSSFVDKNLRVHSAGICLSGKDYDYDLASLVSVIKEGQERRAINRTRVNPERRGDAYEYRYDFDHGEDDDD